MELIKLREHEEIVSTAAEWFHQKWGVPLEAYRESMEACIADKEAVPQWYLALEGDKIVGTRIGIHEKTEIWREMYDLQRTSHRVKTGFSSRKIEVRVYI